MIYILASFLASCNQLFPDSIEHRIGRVEQGLLRNQGDPPWKRMGLTERMAYYNIPGVSIAVINHSQIEWAKGYGVVEAGSNQKVTSGTLFQSASTGKPIVAVAALHYVEQGSLDLDQDVNQLLAGWQIPENQFTEIEKVTLRRLLSHSAGLTVKGFRGYSQGEAIPALQQILDGEPPANSPPIRVFDIPGTRFNYSGGGYMIVQKLLEDLAGRPFPEIMQRTVLDPWGMTASTFVSPLPEDRWQIAASGHRADGNTIPGRWHIYPEMGSGASMWTTPSDLARFVIHIMQAYNGDSDETLSHEMAVLMLSPQLENAGLGLFVGNDGAGRFYFHHDGDNEGYKNFLIGYPERGQGVVIMTNGDNGDALYREILNSFSAEYGWVRNYTFLYVGILAALIVVSGVVLFIRRKGRLAIQNN